MDEDLKRLLGAVERNVETQALVVGHSKGTRRLTIAMTVIQVIVAAFLLWRMDAIAVNAGRQLSEIRAMLSEVLRAQQAVQRAEIAASKAEEASIDSLLKPLQEEQAPESPPPAGTVRYRPDAARRALAAASASAPSPPAIPAAPPVAPEVVEAKKEAMRARVAAIESVDKALGELEAGKRKKE